VQLGALALSGRRRHYHVTTLVESDVSAGRVMGLLLMRWLVSSTGTVANTVLKERLARLLEGTDVHASPYGWFALRELPRTGRCDLSRL
jgi:hypothetical protein